MIKAELIGAFSRTKSHRFKTDERKGCYICWKNLPSVEDLSGHLALHSHSVVLRNCNASWRSLLGKEDTLLDCEINLIASTLAFQVRNVTSSDVKIQFVGVFNEVMEFGKLNPGEFPFTIKAGCMETFRSGIIGLSNFNHYVIVYEETTKKNFEKLQSYAVELNIEQIRIQCDEIDLIADNDINQVIASDPVLSAARFRDPMDSLGAKRIHDFLKIMPLPWYEPSEDVKEFCRASFHAPSSRFFPYLPYNRVFNMINEYRGLTSANYYEMLSVFIQIEDVTARLAVEANTKRDQQLIKRGYGEFAIKLTPREGRPLFLIKGDTVWVGHNADPSVRIRGCVKKVTSEEILLKLRFNSELESLPCYSIHFEVNRLTFQMERKALDDARDFNIINLLFPSEDHRHIPNREITLPQLQFFDPKIKSDVNQIAAVKHIVAGTSYPLPYLLVGFPGTGKTKVIVESVCQLFTYPKNRILVCASSNNVCDEIAQKLIPLLKSTTQYQTPLTQQYNILRLYATSVRRSCKGEELLGNSNFDEKLIPCLDEIYKYRIVVCTLTVAGRLAQGQIDRHHFTNLFIDESESASESYTLIPIVGICCSPNSINANVVLCGDPQQLGPIVRANVSKNMQLGSSLFQRLYYSDPYQKVSRSKVHNQRFISKLKNNYRSNPLLVAVPNKLFYNQEIRSSANPAHFKWYCELDFLPKKGFPILFKNIEGNPEKKTNCLSWYNESEMNCVFDYVQILLENHPRRIKPSDIGIISPYKRQCINIEEMLEQNFLTDIEVGSVEQFQGKEKPIIIISTVRREGIGFMQERERINVMITRAIGLLIIVGHEETLMKNADWRKIIEYTAEHSIGDTGFGPMIDSERNDKTDVRCR